MFALLSLNLQPVQQVNNRSPHTCGVRCQARSSPQCACTSRPSSRPSVPVPSFCQASWWPPPTPTPRPLTPRPPLCMPLCSCMPLWSSVGRGRGAAAAMEALHYLMAPLLHDLMAALQDLMAASESCLRLRRCCLRSYHCMMHHCMHCPRSGQHLGSSGQHRARSGLAVPQHLALSGRAVPPRWRPRQRRADAMADASPLDWRAALPVTLPVTLFVILPVTLPVILPVPLPPRQRGRASTWASTQPRHSA